MQSQRRNKVEISPGPGDYNLEPYFPDVVNYSMKKNIMKT